jgi:hypothetical protein
MSKLEHQDKTSTADVIAADHPDVPVERRPYSAPKVLSAEPLEAVAAVCTPDTLNGLGKTLQADGGICGTLGS